MFIEMEPVSKGLPLAIIAVLEGIVCMSAIDHKVTIHRTRVNHNFVGGADFRTTAGTSLLDSAISGDPQTFT
jgi:hypothetical protein